MAIFLPEHLKYSKTGWIAIVTRGLKTEVLTDNKNQIKKPKMSKTNLSLIIGRSKVGKPNQVWGQMKYQDDLMVDHSNNEVLLIKKMKKLLRDFYSLESEHVEFRIRYDISTLFRFKPFLNISAIAS